MSFFCILGCRHTLNYDNETEVEIKFPKSRYLDITSQSCSWEINYPPDYIISLNIISLDIPVNRSGHCNTQFLEISGIEGNTSSIKFCGNVQQYKLQSQSNTTFIVLQLANNLTETTGFRLNFKGVLNRGKEDRTVVLCLVFLCFLKFEQHPKRMGHVFSMQPI
jgi:hypothetical protein